MTDQTAMPKRRPVQHLFVPAGNHGDKCAICGEVEANSGHRPVEKMPPQVADRLLAMVAEPERFEALAVHGGMWGVRDVSRDRWVATHSADEFGTAQEHAEADALRRNELAFFKAHP